ncbi:exopolysaccharide biosynthesis polyprenyl glycosylphosphotransferase [Phenylobacterium sp.]|uniref:polysaccharide biosynthesis protein HfsE n=1 Tax=Phenylobacterium sp. TaxID=1871053 RepID=UPI0030F37DC5
MSSVVQFQRKESSETGPESQTHATDARVAERHADLPPAERGASEDRRGPFRPKSLIPTRARLQGRVVARMFQAGDIVLLLVAGAIAHRIGAVGAVGLAVTCGGALAVLLSLSLFRAYGFNRREELAHHLARLTGAFAVGAGATFALLLSFTPMATLGQAMAAWAPAAFAATYGLHIVWWLCVRRWRASGRLTPNIVVVGATGAAERLIVATLLSREANILGVFDDRAARSPAGIRGVPVLGDTNALLAHRIMPYVDRIVITVPSQARARVGQMIERLGVLPNEVSLLLDGEDAAHEAAAISRIADVPLAHISGAPMDDRRAVAKRGQDLLVGLAALAVAAPVMLLVAWAIKLDSPGPALFRQRRHGFNNEEIVVWKFRSMRVQSAPQSKVRQTQADDDRVTRVGRFIRKTSLDELPQIFNVLTGEMSLVGPRPHPVGMMTGDIESARLVAEYAHRHRMKPGMTGWAAIHGSRGPVDTPELVKRRVALDVEYIERQSFLLDLYIIVMTLPCLLGDRENIR